MYRQAVFLLSLSILLTPVWPALGESVSNQSPNVSQPGRPGVYSIGPKQDDPRALNPNGNPTGSGQSGIIPGSEGPDWSGQGTLSIGPKQDDPTASNPEGTGLNKPGSVPGGGEAPDWSNRGVFSIGPKQDDPSSTPNPEGGSTGGPDWAGTGIHSIGPKQDDPTTNPHGLVVDPGTSPGPGGGEAPDWSNRGVLSIGPKQDDPAPPNPHGMAVGPGKSPGGEEPDFTGQGVLSIGPKQDDPRPPSPHNIAGYGLRKFDGASQMPGNNPAAMQVLQPQNLKAMPGPSALPQNMKGLQVGGASPGTAMPKIGTPGGLPPGLMNPGALSTLKPGTLGTQTVTPSAGLSKPSALQAPAGGLKQLSPAAGQQLNFQRQH